MIYINGRFLSQPITGVSRMAFELCKSLSEMGIDFTIVAPNKILEVYDISGFKIDFFGIGTSHFWEQFSLPFYFINKKKYLLINLSGLGPLLLKKQIFTVHDMSYWRHPEWFSKKYYYFYKILQPFLARRALHILTISEFSKKEILDCFKISESKISVIYCAASQNNVEKGGQDESKGHSDYILAVSSIEPRKNFQRLLTAFNQIDTNIKLLIIGESNNTFRQIKLDTSDRVVFLGRVSDEELKSYYSKALLFVYPSVYEGFGLPPLEALVMGCPSVVSDIEVFHEVFGNSVGYFNPYEVDDIAKCINHVINLPEYRKQLIDHSSSVINKYTWKASAISLLKIINQYDDDSKASLSD